MHYVYIIYSAKLNRYYVGSTSDIESRLIKHNFNSKGYTGQADDWALCYSEVFELKSDSLRREKQIKRWKNRTRIEELISKGKRAKLECQSIPTFSREGHWFEAESPTKSFTEM